MIFLTVMATHHPNRSGREVNSQQARQLKFRRMSAASDMAHEGPGRTIRLAEIREPITAVSGDQDTDRCDGQKGNRGPYESGSVVARRPGLGEPSPKISDPLFELRLHTLPESGRVATSSLWNHVRLTRFERSPLALRVFSEHRHSCFRFASGAAFPCTHAAAS
jgi:hypothetical protein